MAAAWKQVRRNRIRRSAAGAMLSSLTVALLIDASTSPAHPCAVEAQQADGSGEPVVDTTAAFALTRPVIDSMWEPIAWPMRHIELEGLAKRLGLSHEQKIAVERLYLSYFEEACIKRVAAIDALMRLDPDAMRLPHAVAPLDDVKRAVQARRAWLSTLATLEAALFLRIGETFGDDQSTRLAREAMRRERARLATDAWVAQWWGNGGNPHGGPPLPEIIVFELTDVLETMMLEPAVLPAAEQAVVRGEAAHLRQLQTLFDAACEARIRWCDVPGTDQPNPRYAAISAIATELAVLAGRCIAVERENIERVAATLPADFATEFRDRAARAISGDLYETWTGFAPYARAVLAQESLPADQRERIAAMLADFERQARPLRYQWLLASREAGKYMSLRIGGRALSTQVDNSFEDANAAIESMLAMSNARRQETYGFISDEIASAASKKANAVDFQRQTAQSDASFAPSSNFNVPGTNAHPSWILPRSPAAADIESVLRRAAVDEDSAAVVRTLNEERAAAWEAIVKAAARVYSEEHNVRRNEEVRIPDIARVFGAYRDALAQLAASEAAFIDSLRVALDDISSDAIELIALGRAWASLTMVPSTLPTPHESGRNSPRSMIRSHLDRVNMLRVLLDADASSEAIAPGIAALGEQSATTAANVAAYRTAVVDALEADSLLMYAMQPQFGGSWTKAKDQRLKQDEKSLRAIEARKTMHGQLRHVRDVVAAAMDVRTAGLYRAAVQRIAYPSAVSGVEAALARFDGAAAIADLNEEQRGRLSVARSEAESQLRAIADEIEALIDAHVEAEAYTPEAEAKCAAIYARLEHAMFIKDERCAAAIARVRPILTAAQCEALLNPRSVQP